ncbi:MAG: hypothetical protein AAFY91_14075, partial [Bacteroidota bacterium]
MCVYTIIAEVRTQTSSDMQNEDENPQLTGIAAIDNEIISRCPELKEEPSEIRTELSNQILHF